MSGSLWVSVTDHHVKHTGFKCAHLQSLMLRFSLLLVIRKTSCTLENRESQKHHLDSCCRFKILCLFTQCKGL